MLMRIVSGGQTGVDRGALDAALSQGFESGGWCPRGRLAEDGTIPARYPLRETSSVDVAVRTRRNVYTSDATLILCHEPRLAGGTLLTRNLALHYGKPVMVQLLDGHADPSPVITWLRSLNVRTLNLAGPRESEDPGIQKDTEKFVCRLIDTLRRHGLADRGRDTHA